MEVGRRIQQVRKERGVTQQTLADRISLSRASITNVEQGRQKILLHTLVGIACALRVPVLELMPLEQSRPSQPLDDLLKQRPDAEQAWIASALSSFSSKPESGPA